MSINRTFSFGSTRLVLGTFQLKFESENEIEISFMLSQAITMIALITRLLLLFSREKIANLPIDLQAV